MFSIASCFLRRANTSFRDYINFMVVYFFVSCVDLYVQLSGACLVLLLLWLHERIHSVAALSRVAFVESYICFFCESLHLFSSTCLVFVPVTFDLFSFPVSFTIVDFHL